MLNSPLCLPLTLVCCTDSLMLMLERRQSSQMLPCKTKTKIGWSILRHGGISPAWEMIPSSGPIHPEITGPISVSSIWEETKLTQYPLLRLPLPTPIWEIRVSLPAILKSALQFSSILHWTGFAIRTFKETSYHALCHWPPITCRML